MYRAVLLLAIPVAALVCTAGPAEAATPARPALTAPTSQFAALACPGVFCSPWWKVNRGFVEGRLP